ncbi:FAD binding domain-containing protein [Brevibacterium sp. RIT 803]|uniref:FAD binding domain-containing protein n=1 Tax=Brevibacterium sp. RIT 803 TaxID=2810210 RepID=UPI00194DC3D8|nr:FAD binding domain-containing protein [Brevibacterium sp. RIT 803]MBM6591493.1 FAD binding domain-containing protein [Brevibacterium sp. RIT 803]
MKPSPLRIHRPKTVEDTLELLAAHASDGKIIAGGQSLVPVLNMRLASPKNLIDITAVEGLDGLTATETEITVGALVSHRRLERDPGAACANPVLGEALGHVAHPAIRNRGTTVGSIAHADPNGEMPMILALTGGRVKVRSLTGTRTLTADELNVGPLETSLEPEELITEASFPSLQPGQRAGFDELARRSGDYGLAGVGLIMSTDNTDFASTSDRADYVDNVDPASSGAAGTAATITGLKAGFVSVTDTPDIIELDDVVAGTPVDRVDTIVDAVASAIKDFIDPEGDIHASADYRRHLTGVLAGRLLKRLSRPKNARGVSVLSGGQ